MISHLPPHPFRDPSPRVAGQELSSAKGSSLQPGAALRMALSMISNNWKVAAMAGNNLTDIVMRSLISQRSEVLRCLSTPAQGTAQCWASTSALVWSF